MDDLLELMKTRRSIRRYQSFFTFELQGCAHLPVEAWLEEEGVPAFVCPPINMILYKIRQLIDLAVEFADISVHQKQGKCVLRVVIFKQ